MRDSYWTNEDDAREAMLDRAQVERTRHVIERWPTPNVSSPSPEPTP